ncbi:MAG: division/cell wall cluster transcriptional repressor MraZ [bacterium]|nr:division/cell wall cluster transcriptional repressor MraZ [bacterium]
MYFGEFQSKLDDKGRITVPRRIRETMDVNGHAVWYLTRGFDNCVFVFHRDSWNDIRRQASRYSSMNAEALDFRRLLFGSVAEVKPDGQGRMLVAPHLRDHADLDKEVVLLGVDDHLELWSAESWRAFQERSQDKYREMAGPLFAGDSGTGVPEGTGAAAEA